MEGHIKAAGFVLLAFGVLSLLGGVIVMVIGMTIPSLIFAIDPPHGDEAAVLGIVFCIVSLMGVGIALFSLPGIIGGLAVLYRKPWGRILAIIAAALNLPSIPVGTAAGVYCLWALLSRDAEEYFHPDLGG